jgi:uncharacterized protein HemY
LQEKETILVAAKDPTRYRSTQRFLLLGILLLGLLVLIFALHKMYAKITREAEAAQLFFKIRKSRREFLENFQAIVDFVCQSLNSVSFAHTW